MQRGKKKQNNDILLDNKQLPGEGSGPCLLRRAVGEEEGGVQGMVAPKGDLLFVDRVLKATEKGVTFSPCGPWLDGQGGPIRKPSWEKGF